MFRLRSCSVLVLIPVQLPFGCNSVDVSVLLLGTSKVAFRLPSSHVSGSGLLSLGLVLIRIGYAPALVRLWLRLDLFRERFGARSVPFGSVRFWPETRDAAGRGGELSDSSKARESHNV